MNIDDIKKQAEWELDLASLGQAGKRLVDISLAKFGHKVGLGKGPPPTTAIYP